MNRISLLFGPDGVSGILMANVSPNSEASVISSLLTLDQINGQPAEQFRTSAMPEAPADTTPAYSEYEQRISQFCAELARAGKEGQYKFSAGPNGAVELCFRCAESVEEFNDRKLQVPAIVGETLQDVLVEAFI